jgi:hypothetical protein
VITNQRKRSQITAPTSATSAAAATKTRSGSYIA